MADGLRGWAVLGVLGGWALATPYAGTVLGLDVDVAASVEIVDHVVPGLAVAAAAALVLLRPARARPDGLPLVAASLALLGGLWMTTSHVPLLLDAAEGTAPLAASLWHTAAGPPTLGLAAWLLAGEYRASAPR